MKRQLLPLLLLVLGFCGTCLGAQTQAKQAGEDPIYSKLFKDKAKLQSAKGTISLHRYDGKVYVEMPVELLKREFLLRSIVAKSNNMSFNGVLAGPQRYLTLERQDSILFYKEKVSNIVINAQDSVQAEAMKLSKGSPIFMRFPIKGYSADSTRLIYDATELYDPNNKDLLDLKGKPYSGLIIISSMSANARATFFNGIEAFDSSIMVSNTLSAKLDLNFLGILPLGFKPEVSLECYSYMMLLPEQPMRTRIASDYVGVGIAPFYDYRPRIDTRWRDYATRRRLSPDRPQTFYIDTLIQPSWRQAIGEAAELWNDSFERIGLGRPLRIVPFPQDKGFDAENPMLDVIKLVNAGGRAVGLSNTLDPRTGEILSSRLTVSRDAASGIRAIGMIQLGAVDPRFRTYYVPDDAICDGLRALALRQFGLALGLISNMAGSHAYSPEQIRSAEFTQAHGFTASVMDDVIFNTLALPGDKERGVALALNRVGTADEHALQYLYGDFGPEAGEEEALKTFARKHDGDPRYLYIGDYSIAPSDPRAQSGDLGNDPITLMRHRSQNIKYVMREGPKWIAGDEIPQGFTQAFPDMVIQEYFAGALGPLYAYIGGFYVNEVNQASPLPLYTVIDKATQRRVAHALIEAASDLEWLNGNKDFLALAGIDARVTETLSRQGQPLNALLQRFKLLPFTEAKAKDTYTAREFATDIERYLFADVHQGRQLSPEKLELIKIYIGYIVGLSPSLKEIDTANKKQGRAFFSLVEDTPTADQLLGHEPEWVVEQTRRSEAALRRLQAIAYFSLGDRTPELYQTLERVRGLLERSKASSSDKLYRSKIDYYLRSVRELTSPSKRRS